MTKLIYTRNNLSCNVLTRVLAKQFNCKHEQNLSSGNLLTVLNKVLLVVWRDYNIPMATLSTTTNPDLKLVGAP